MHRVQSPPVCTQLSSISLNFAISTDRRSDIATLLYSGCKPCSAHRGLPTLPSLREPWPRCAEQRSEEHTSELQSLMRISYAVLCLKTKINTKTLTKNLMI